MHASTDYSTSSDDDGDVAPGSPIEEDSIGSAGAAVSWPVAEGIVSSLRTQEEVDRVCRMYGVSKEFIARPAGDLRMCSPPPQGAVCVYSHALEAGFCRAPLQDFFCDVLLHFSLAPSQLAPNGWRNMAHFHGLCRSAGVRPSVTLFRQFFRVYKIPRSNGTWYYFRSTHISSPARLPPSNSNWKEGFFFLSSPVTWTCPVQWGVPSDESRIQPVLKGDEVAAARKLLSARGSASVDVVKTMHVKIEPESDVDAPDWPPPTPSRRKRNLEEANVSLLQAVKQAIKLQKELVARERDAAKESHARRKELKQLTAVLNEAVKATSASEKQKAAADLLQEEVKRLTAELGEAKKAATAEGEKAAALQKLTAELKDAKKAATAEGERAAALRKELEKLKATEAKKAELMKAMMKEFAA